MDYRMPKQVTRIEYVGPYQIQTTTSPSANFSGRIDLRNNRFEIVYPGASQADVDIEKRMSSATTGTYPMKAVLIQKDGFSLGEMTVKLKGRYRYEQDYKI